MELSQGFRADPSRTAPSTLGFISPNHDDDYIFCGSLNTLFINRRIVLYTLSSNLRVVPIAEALRLIVFRFLNTDNSR